MATIPFIPQQQSRQSAGVPNATWGLFIAAALLALLLGLSAVDIQQHRAMDGTGPAELDGRGKWAGYL